MSEDIIKNISQVLNWISMTQDIKTINIFDKKGLLREKARDIQQCLEKSLKANPQFTEIKMKSGSSKSIGLTV